MNFSSRSRRVTLAIAAGSVPLLLALTVNRLHSQPPAPVVPIPAAVSPKQVADDLDAIIQPRFQDDRAGVFGMSRVVPMIGGHLAVNNFQPVTKAETQLWDQANSAGHPYQVEFLHSPHVLGNLRQRTSSGTPIGWPQSKPYLSLLLDHPLSPPDWNDPKVRQQAIANGEARQSQLLKAATDALPNLMQGKGQEKTVKDYLVVMRPVRASKDSCLTCHGGAKRGDTFGVMVYAVSSK